MKHATVAHWALLSRGPSNLAQLRLFEKYVSFIYVFETNWYVLKKDGIGQIKVPTLIIRGENTNKSSRYISDSLRKLLSNSAEAVITRSGHFPQTENPEELNSKLLEFLAKNSS